MVRISEPLKGALKNDVPELFDVRLVLVIYASFQSAMIAVYSANKSKSN